MTADAEGNDLEKVFIPVTGFLAVQLTGEPTWVAPTEGSATPLVLPEGYVKVGLFKQDGGPQDGGYLQQLPCIQAAPHIRPVEAGPHGLDAGEAGAPPLNEHLHRGGGLLLGPLHIVRVGHGPQGQAALLPLLGGGAGGQLLQHPGKFQGGDGLFKQVGHHTCVSCLC